MAGFEVIIYGRFWVIAEAFGGSLLNDSTRGLTHRLILSLDPERHKNRLAKPSGK
jgi:hypothetical protein